MRLILSAYALTCLALALAADFGRLGPTLSAITMAPMGDKVLHGLFAGGLALLTNLVCIQSKPAARWLALAAGTVAVMFVCAAEEATNLLTPHRSCGLDDLLANYLGILLIGVVPCVLLLRRPTPQRVAA